MRLALVVLALLFAGTAQAAEVAKPAAFYLGLSAADLATTEWARSNGASERNAFMAGHRIEKQLLMAAAFTALDVRLQRSRRAKPLRIVVAVVRVAAIAINVRHARRDR